MQFNKYTHTQLRPKNRPLIPKKKIQQLLHTANSTTDADTKKNKNIKQLVRTGNSMIDTRVVVFLVFLKYAPFMLGLDNSSCEYDEYTDFDVPSTPHVVAVCCQSRFMID